MDGMGFVSLTETVYIPWFDVAKAAEQAGILRRHMKMIEPAGETMKPETPGKMNGWNLQISQLKRKINRPNLHVTFPGCMICCWEMIGCKKHFCN